MPRRGPIRIRRLREETRCSRTEFICFCYRMFENSTIYMSWSDIVTTQKRNVLSSSFAGSYSHLHRSRHRTRQCSAQQTKGNGSFTCHREETLFGKLIYYACRTDAQHGRRKRAISTIHCSNNILSSTVSWREDKTWEVDKDVYYSLSLATQSASQTPVLSTQRHEPLLYLQETKSLQNASFPTLPLSFLFVYSHAPLSISLFPSLYLAFKCGPASKHTFLLELYKR